MSLPLALQTTLDTLPPPLPLVAHPQKLAHWRSRLGPFDGLRIGIAWTGNATHNLDAQRSLRLRDLDPVLRLAGAGRAIEFVSLQKEFRQRDSFALYEYSSHGLRLETIADLDDVAALICLCDAVISVDTAVAHLAASLGADVRVLLPFAPDWRWGLARRDCPWYPTVRLFRQTIRNDWTQPVAALREGLVAELDLAGAARAPA